MITVNTDGNPISAGLVDAIQSDSPSTTARFWYNGAELPCDIDSITVEKGSCGSDTFMVGDVIGDMLTATVKNLTTDIKGEKIECHIGYLVGGDYEYVSLGIFTVAEVKTTRYETYITAYSSVISDTSTRLYTQGLNSPTIAQLASRIAGQMNCLVTFDEGIDTSLQIGAVLEGLTVYQALQVLAICSGGYVTNTNDGNVRIRQFATTADRSVDTGIMIDLPQIAEKPYTVESIGVMVSEATVDNEGNAVEEIFYSDNPSYIIVTKQGTDYYLKDEQGNYILANLSPETADVYFSCSYMTAEIFNTNVKGIKGYTYSPATVGLSLGDPRLEGCDVLEVTDVDGNTYIVPCHKLTHSYTGGFKTDVKSCDASDNANGIGTALPITQRLQTLSRETGKAQASADNAYKIAGDTNQYFWFMGEGTDTGAHITETPQEQFRANPTQGGGNLLARSNGVAIRDGLEELASFSANGVNLNQNGQSVATFNSSGVDLKQGGSSVANFGANGSRIGKSSESNVTTSSTGVRIQQNSSNYADVSSNGLEVYQGGESVAIFGANGTFIYNEGSVVAKITKGSGADNGRIGIGALLTADNDSRVTIDDWSGTNLSQGDFTVKYKDGSMTGSSHGRMEVTATSNQAKVRISASGAGYSSAYIDIASMSAYPDGGIVLEARKMMLSLSTNPSSGDDYALYQAINALGWASDVIE